MRVAIIGAGLAGTTLGLLLRQHGLDCDVFERRPVAREGAGIVIASNGLAVLEQAGVLSRLLPQSVAAGPWQFENQQGRLLARVQDARYATAFQTRIVSRHILQQTMEEEARGKGVRIHRGMRLNTLQQDATTTTLHFEDGQQYMADCVIGADGVGSSVRKNLFPELPTAHYTGFTAFAGISAAQENCPPVNEQQPVHLMFGRTCAFEYTTIWTEGGLRTLWWSTHQTDLVSRERRAEQTLADHRQYLQEQHVSWHPVVRNLLDSAEEITPIAIHEGPTLTQWSRGRVCVLGDAAHSIGPHSGQAAAMALEDAATAANLLGRCDLQSVEKQLKRLTELRQQRTQRVMQIGHRAEGRKSEMSRLQYWLLQQNMRFRVPLGALKDKSWLLDYRVRDLQ